MEKAAGHAGVGVAAREFARRGQPDPGQGVGRPAPPARFQPGTISPRTPRAGNEVDGDRGAEITTMAIIVGRAAAALTSSAPPGVGPGSG